MLISDHFLEFQNNVFRLSFPKLKELYEKEFLQTVKTEEANDEIIKNNNNNRGTLSNILNSLDGLLASEDYIIIATTNHIDSIDPAILRPGRFDYKIEISSVEIEAYKQFCSKFYPNEVIPDDIIIENDISIASMQEIALSGASYEEFKSIFTVNKEQCYTLLFIHNSLKSIPYFLFIFIFIKYLFDDIAPYGLFNILLISLVEYPLIVNFKIFL